MTKKLSQGVKRGQQKMVRAIFRTRTFRQILKEWARQVVRQEDPTTFANMYLEWMRDPVERVSRVGCSTFASFMKTRSWDEVLSTVKPKLDKTVLKAFETSFAKVFYKGFKATVVGHVNAYWKDFRATVKAAARKRRQQIKNKK